MHVLNRITYYLCLGTAVAAGYNKDYACTAAFLCCCILLNQYGPKK